MWHINSLVIRNECCFCFTAMASFATACQHVRNASKRGLCPVGKSFISNRLTPLPDEVVCSVCQEEFDTADEYYKHVVQHVQEIPKVKCHQCYKMFADVHLLRSHQCTQDPTSVPSYNIFAAEVGRSRSPRRRLWAFRCRRREQ